MASKMTIGIEVQRIFRAKKHGMEIVALELLKALQALDRTNQYILFAKKDTDISCFQPAKNVQVSLVGGRTYADWEQVWLPRAVKRSGVDFLHATCNTATWNPPVPLLLTLHDIIYLENIDFKGTAYQNFGNLYRRIVVPKAVQNSKFVLTVSAYEQEVIQTRFPWAAEKIKVVYNAVGTQFHARWTSPQLETFRRKYNLPEKFMLFLGNTAPKKNTPNVLKAYVAYCKRTPVVQPLVILDYDRMSVAQFLKSMGEERILQHIIFPGYVPMSEMPLMYSAAFLFLYPSLRESFGLPILEAMACGTPVITSNTSSMPEIAGGAGLLVDPTNSSSIAQAMSRLDQSNSLRKQMIANGLERAAKFNWRASAEQLLAIYLQMMNN